ETELTDSIAEDVGHAFATVLRGAPSHGSATRVALGRDVRPSSERLSEAIERGLVASGVVVERVGVVPTPALYYAVASRDLDGGLQVTGSHNPPEFNGFKMTRKKLPVFGDEILRMRDLIERRAFAAGPGGSASDRPILADYRTMLSERLAS